jgi:alginate O-acetyltransferase complex protein AlgI
VVFSSIAFLVYFLPFAVALYFLAPQKLRNPFLLLASILFYSWGAPRFIFVILLTTWIDFHLVRAMHRQEKQGRRKLMLALSVTMNVGLLFFFKYYNFFTGNINLALQAAGLPQIGLLEVILPIGISFYTFETITYVVDVYRRVHDPLNRLRDYLLYIILFPKLIAGPIIRYHEIADQINGRHDAETAGNRLNGFYRFTLGLCKKVFIANTMAEYADMTFNKDALLVNGAEAWTGMLCYTFQIYFDFSGYSDMAIGLGRMFGFIFPENFNNPYTSMSITEFWKRWHITLGNWMRNYLYIPLGGNRRGTTRTYLNLWLVFLLSGLWHGAAWTFIVWGAFHGGIMVVERFTPLRLQSRASRVLAWGVTFLLTCTGWVIFRSETIPQALTILSRLFSADFRLQPEYFNGRFISMFLVACLFSFYGGSEAVRRMQAGFYAGLKTNAAHIATAAIACILFTLAVATVSSTHFNPFIYFRF